MNAAAKQIYFKIYAAHQICFSSDVKNRIETAEAVRLFLSVARVVRPARAINDEFITVFAGRQNFNRCLPEAVRLFFQMNVGLPIVKIAAERNFPRRVVVKEK